MIRLLLPLLLLLLSPGAVHSSLKSLDGTVNQLVIGNCTAASSSSSSSSPTWTVRPDGRLSYLNLGCATAVSPVANNGLVILAPCGAANQEQIFAINKTAWSASAPNVSWSISLAPHSDVPNVGWGWTYDKGGGNLGYVNLRLYHSVSTRVASTRA